ncbi:hypothetical protein AB0G15_25170 [Streptosporangium sp. NPDC023825]|uniref:hypothetical protein n=1 Tax=Streptosporangium sp. NPDC023825 TaxID=3154909 RepID=UPI0034463B42
MFARHVGEPHTGSPGIGPALVGEVTDAHGGTIDVDGRPGAGASFTALLLRAAPDDRARCLSRVFAAAPLSRAG